MTDLKKDDRMHGFMTKIIHNRFFWWMLVFVGVLLKLSLFRVQTGDYNVFLVPWMDFIRTHGYFHSLAFSFSDYNPAYIYFLIFITKAGCCPLFLVKLLSVGFEYLMAYFLALIIGLDKDLKNSVLMVAVFAIVPLLPTVLLNSSYLAQCDSIYTAFAVGSIYFALKRRSFWAMIMLGIAFSFKFQSAVLLPFYFVWWLRGNIRWYYFLVVPAVYVLSLMPAVFYGRSLPDVLSIIVLQSKRYPFLTLNFPNIYIWMDNRYYEPMKTAGLIITVAATLVLGIVLKSKKYLFDDVVWVKLVFLSAIMVPFLLPGMHERYMYFGDVFGVVYLVYHRNRFYLPLGIVLVSAYSYIRCSKYNDVLPQYPAFFIYTAIIILVIYDLYRTFSLKDEQNAEIQ